MNILDTIVKSLRDAGPRTWDGIAEATGLSAGTLRKIAYYDLQNPTLQIVQTLLDYFADVKAKKIKLPKPVPTKYRSGPRIPNKPPGASATRGNGRSTAQ